MAEKKGAKPGTEKKADAPHAAGAPKPEDFADDTSSSSKSKKRKFGDSETKSRKILVAPDKDTLRILVATDNHLGFNENDNIRGEDSFRAFEEIMQIARDNEVDFILLGGDLFHDNKPSRLTLFRAVTIFRKYCFGDRPVQFEIVSDQSVNFPDTGCVNYEDPNFNISLPVFAIHGNHDDPAGVGGYSAMDLMHQCNLLNYFGKSEKVDDIENYPILLKKGVTKVAMYGMGNIRDERLHRTFKANKVKWIRPAKDKEEWFNFTRHTQEQKNYISESMLPDFLDFVIWGHEHECLIEPEASAASKFFVSQPGSSVATSLCQGESVEKKVGLLEIKKDLYRMVAVPLKTVRPFKMADFKLSEYLDANDPKTEQIEELLTDRVSQLLEELQKETKSAEKPLLRLRVDHTGFPKINVTRFGQTFVGRVANPEDLLSFHRQRQTAKKPREKNAPPDPEVDLLEAGEADATPPIHTLVSSILKESNVNLTILSERRLAEAVQEYVDKKELDAISSFVSTSLQNMKKELVVEPGLETKDEIAAMVQKKYEKEVAKDRVEEEKDKAEREKARASRNAEIGSEGKEPKDGKEAKEKESKSDARAAAPAASAGNEDLDLDHSDVDMEGEEDSEMKAMQELLGIKSKGAGKVKEEKKGAKPKAKAKTKAKAKGKAAPKKGARGRKKKDEDEDEDDDMSDVEIDLRSDSDEDESPKKKKKAPAKPKAKSRAKKKDSDDEDEDAGDRKIEIDDDDNSDVEMVAAKPASSSSSASVPAGSKRKAPASTKASEQTKLKSEAKDAGGSSSSSSPSTAAKRPRVGGLNFSSSTASQAEDAKTSIASWGAAKKPARAKK